MLALRAVTLVGAVACVLAQADKMPRFLGEVKFPRPPAFMELFEDENPTDPVDSLTLYISSFAPLNLFQFDSIYYMRSPGAYLGDLEAFVDNMVEVDGENNWANNPDRLPSSVVGREGVIWNSGFLVPGKTHGRLNMYFWDQEGWDGPYNIASEDVKDWSYHRVIWKDCDGDGDQDAMVGRFHVGVFGDTETDFSWLENPGTGPSEGWTQHFIAESGPDVHYRNVDLDNGDGTFADAFIAGEFWNEEIAVWYTPDNNWGDINVMFNVERVLIDAPGQVFDVYVDDFNMDGKLDLLATVYDGEEGFVYVYDIPENWKTNPWPRRTIASGFKANFILGGQSMTPGSPKPFYPSVEAAESGVKPYISVSGDDDGCLYILTPNSEDPEDWSYEKNLLIDSEDTTSGKMAIGDMDNDGYTDIIGAGYTAEKLFFFTYAPEA